MLNYMLQFLVEAAKDKEEDAAEDTADKKENETPEEESETDTTDPLDEPEEKENQEQEEEEQEEETDEESSEDENTEENDTEGDDFSMDDGEDSTDDDPPPDGLVDPDDAGEDDEDEDSETNVHVNILQLSKMDRALAKRQCFNDYQELRTSIRATRNLIDNNETMIEPDVRSEAFTKLDRLAADLNDYLTYKFGYINYEENLQNYMLFTKTLNDIITKVHSEWDTSPNRRKKDKSKSES